VEVVAYFIIKNKTANSVGYPSMTIKFSFNNNCCAIFQEKCWKSFLYTMYLDLSPTYLFDWASNNCTNAYLRLRLGSGPKLAVTTRKSGCTVIVWLSLFDKTKLLHGSWGRRWKQVAFGQSKTLRMFAKRWWRNYLDAFVQRNCYSSWSSEHLI